MTLSDSLCRNSLRLNGEWAKAEPHLDLGRDLSVSRKDDLRALFPDGRQAHPY